MMHLIVGALLKSIDDYDGSRERFLELMREAWPISRQLAARSPDLTRAVAEASGQDPNLVGAWVNGKAVPYREEDRREVLRHVRNWFLHA